MPQLQKEVKGMGIEKYRGSWTWGFLQRHLIALTLLALLTGTPNAFGVITTVGGADENAPLQTGDCVGQIADKSGDGVNAAAQIAAEQVLDNARKLNEQCPPDACSPERRMNLARRFAGKTLNATNALGAWVGKKLGFAKPIVPGLIITVAGILPFAGAILGGKVGAELGTEGSALAIFICVSVKLAEKLAEVMGRPYAHQWSDTVGKLFSRAFKTGWKTPSATLHAAFTDVEKELLHIQQGAALAVSLLMANSVVPKLRSYNQSGNEENLVDAAMMFLGLIREHYTGYKQIFVEEPFLINRVELDLLRSVDVPETFGAVVRYVAEEQLARPDGGFLKDERKDPKAFLAFVDKALGLWLHKPVRPAIPSHLRGKIGLEPLRSDPAAAPAPGAIPVTDTASALPDPDAETTVERPAETVNATKRVPVAAVP